MGSILWKIKHQITQSIYRKKYGEFEIPIQNNGYWYYKQHVRYQTKETIEIQRVGPFELYHFEDYVNYGLYFKYRCGKYKYLSDKEIEEHQNFAHSHDFCYVLQEVYNFPESFYIEKEDEVLYSERERIWIEKLKEQCIKDGLNDIGYYGKNKCEKRRGSIDLKYNILELKKRNIHHIFGISIKKHLNECHDENTYLELIENHKINLFKEL